MELLKLNDGDLVVVKSNKLVEACYRLDLIQLRVIMLAVVIARELDVLRTGPDHGECKPFTIDVKRFRDFYPMEEGSAYGQIKEAVKAINRKPITYIEDMDGEPCPAEIHWFSKAVYNAKKGSIQLEFSKYVIPYITRLESQFTEYRLAKIGMLTSAHAVRLYELLFQYLKAGRREVKIEWLKKTLMLEGEYSDIYDLKKRVVDPSVKQINELTDLEIGYVNVKAGREIVALAFTIKMKDMDKPKTKAWPIDKTMIAAAAKPGETHDDAYNRIRADRVAARKPARKRPVQMDLSGVGPASNPQSPKVKVEREKMLAAARAK